MGILLFIISSSRIYAQTEDSIIVSPKAEYNECLIHFRSNQSLVDSRYMSNAKELLRLKSTFLRIFSDVNCSVDSIAIYVSSSPDGNFYTNQWLMRARVKSLCDYLHSEFPKLKNEKIIITSDPENWNGLKQVIANDLQIPRQKDLLNIIDTASTPALKKRKIKELDNGAAYAYIFRHYSHRLRCASIRTVWHSSQNDTDSTVRQQPPIPPKLEDSKAKTVGSLYAPLQQLLSSNTTPEPLDIGNTEARFALKTNLLYLAALCLNIEAELYVGNRWSVNLDYQYAWWSNKAKHKYYRLAAVSPEVRYWFASKKNFKGHFAGIYVGAGLYEFMAQPSSGIQGEFFIAGGVTYGWAFPVSKWMNMEFSVGIGYMMSEYRKYYHDVDCYVYNDTQRFTYFGPTKAKVSLVFPLHIKKRIKTLN